MAAGYQMLFELNAALGGGFASAFTQGSQQIDNLRGRLEALNSAGNTGDLLGGISAALQTTGIVKALSAAFDVLKECASASIEFESAMTGVSKTTDMSVSELESMSSAVMKLSTEMPVTTTELANVMEVAGQLGIKKDNLLDFSTTMSQLATATTMTADEAATMLAQFANITQMDPSKYGNLASSVVDLGNNYATTEQKIVEMGQGIAASGSLAGMSEADMMGLSAAVTSLGIETAAGSTSMSKLISQINTAVETGDDLDAFASVSGMSADQFKKAWGDDAANALATFVTGLNDVERNGASAGVILGDLGIKEARMQRMILSLAGSGDLMSNAIRDANAAFESNTALSAEAEKRYATTESRLTMLSNAANNVKISIGDALTPMIASAASGLTGLLEPVAEFIGQNPAIVQGLTAFVGVLGVATAAVAAYTAVTKLAAAANLLFGGTIPGAKIILGVAAGVGALVYGFNALQNALAPVQPTFEELDAQFDKLMEQADEQQKIIDLAEEYKSLTKEIADLESSEGTISEKVDVSGVKKSDMELLKEIAEHNGYTVNADGTVTQTLDITGVSKQDLKQLESLKTAYVEKKAKLTQELSLLGIENVEEKLGVYMQFKTNTKEGRYALKQQLELDGAENITDAKVAQIVQLMGVVGDKEGKLSQKLELLGFDAAAIKSMGYSSMEAFVEAVQAGKIITSADGTLTQKLVMDDIKPEAVATINQLKESIVTEKGVLEQDLAIRGVEDVQAKMDTYLSFKVNTADGVHALKQQLEIDGVENISDEQLGHLKEFIRNIQTKEGKLTQKLETSGFDAATISTLGYSSMEAFVAAVEAGQVVISADGKITQTVDVSGDLAALKEANEQEVALASAEAAEAAAAEELAAKKERLKAVTQALRDSSGGLIDATDSETDALNKQIEAYENVARARKDQYTAEALDTIKKQSKAFVASLSEESAAAASLDKAHARKDLIMSFINSGNAVEHVRKQFNELQKDGKSYTGFNWLTDSNEEAKALQDRFYGLQDVMSAITGREYNFPDTLQMGTAIKDMVVTTATLEDSWNIAAETATGYANAVEAADKTQQTYIQNLVNGVYSGTLQYEDLEVALQDAFKDYANGGELVESTMQQVKAGVEAAKAAAEGSGDSAKSEADKAVEAVGNVIERMDALKKSYEEAKKAALEALGGRFKLFDDPGKKEKSKSTKEMKDNLKAQQEYWNEYNSNLQKALDNGLAPEIAKQLADGSAESAATLETLANATPETIQEINDGFAGLTDSKDTLASTIAEMETGFSDGMSKLQEELNQTVAQMNKGGEAAAAAAETMSAYVDGLNASGGGAAEAAAKVAEAVNAALSTIASVDVDITYHYKTEGEPPEGTVIPEHKNAIGTDYAARGLTLVGEEGPELVYMNGGEKVLTAHETANALNAAGSGTVVELAFTPTYNINGGGNPEEIRRMLAEHTRITRDELESMLADIVGDQRRRAYA